MYEILMIRLSCIRHDISICSTKVSIVKKKKLSKHIFDRNFLQKNIAIFLSYFNQLTAI